MSNETEIEKVLRLKKAEYSVRAIAKNIGISKSQVQRILEENKKNQPSQSVSQPSQSNYGTTFEPSQNVSQVSQRVSQTVSQEIRDGENELLKTEKTLKEWERKFKNQFDKQLQILLVQKDFSLDELDFQIQFFSDGKDNVDILSQNVIEVTGDENFKFSTFLKDLLIHLRKAQIKMNTLKYKELKNDRDFSFDKALRFVYEEQEEQEQDDDEEQEYDDDNDDEDENSEVEQQLCIVVKLWGRYDSTLKSQVQSKINDDGLGFEW
jgi:hypothetical protein